MMTMTSSVKMAVRQLKAGRSDMALKTLLMALNLVERRSHRETIRGHVTSCIHGHQFTPQNTYVRPDGYFECRQCMADARSKRRADGQLKFRRGVAVEGPCRKCGGVRYREPSGGVRCRACASKRERDRRLALKELEVSA